MKQKLIFEKYVSSTNDRIKEIKLEKKKNGSFGLLSEKQLNGKGRKGNKWFSTNGDLTCSILIDKKFNVKDFGRINIIVAVSIIKVLFKIFPKLNFKLKWPNDIFLKKKKIAGILIETSILRNKIEYLVIGFGLNVISEPLSENYQTTCLKRFTENIDINDIFRKIFKALDKNLSSKNIKSFKIFKNYWLSKAKDVGKEIKVKRMKSFVSGIFETLSEDGSLVIVLDKKKIRIEA
ncbi:MAG: biotin--[acetyl-CoA-carboxylase] ligase [Rickettsiales bacterium]|nr:biotin--[acetyl-CoA-carboxylase] ligase [Rickettsiales bacterium]